nr:polysaccharide deacetylase family protein [uncultured Blautia sp.]
MKKRSRKTGKALAAILAALILSVGIGDFLKTVSQNPQKAIETAARIIAGKGMLRLAERELDPPLVALTFDDGPDAEYTELLLDGLKERGAKASFFLLGKCLEGREELLIRMKEEGHLIGNHTYNHVRLDKLTPSEAREEILKTNNRIYEVTGEYPVYLRPPYGAWKKDLELYVEMIPVLWNVDTLDWKCQDVSSILAAVRKNVKNGSVILMHDEYAATVKAALAIVDELKKEGYEFVTVDRLILP